MKSVTSAFFLLLITCSIACSQSYDDGGMDAYSLKIDNHLYIRQNLLAGSVTDGDYLRLLMFTHMGSWLSADSTFFRTWSFYTPQVRLNFAQVNNFKMVAASEFHIITKDLFGFFNTWEAKDVKFRPWNESKIILDYYPADFLRLSVEAGYRLNLAPNEDFFKPKYHGGYVGFSAGVGLFDYDSEPASKRKIKKEISDNIIDHPEKLSEASLLKYLRYYENGTYSDQVRYELYNYQYEDAIAKATMEAYHDFLKSVPESFEKYQEINSRYIDLKWQECLKSESAAEIENFITTYPDSKYTQDAVVYKKYFECDQTSAFDLNNFLLQHPDFSLKDTLQSRISFLYNSMLKKYLVSDHIDSIKLVIKAIPDLNKELNADFIPVFYAKSWQAYELLAEHGADLNYLNQFGQNCLVMHLDKPNLFNYLIREGVDPLITDTKYGMSLLHWAAYKNSGEVISYLLSNPGIDINLKADDGNTALDYIDDKNVDVIKQFIAHPDFDFSNYYLSIGFLSALYDNGDLSYAKKLLTRKGYKVLDQFAADRRFTTRSFESKYNILLKNKNITGRSAGSCSNCELYNDGWMIIDNDIYVLGSYKLFTNFNEFEFGKNSILFTK